MSRYTGKQFTADVYGRQRQPSRVEAVKAAQAEARSRVRQFYARHGHAPDERQMLRMVEAAVEVTEARLGRPIRR